MFRLVSKRRAWWPVIFAGVSEEGEIVENRVELRFTILDEDEIVGFYQKLTAANEAPPDEGAPLGASTRVAPVLLEIIDDWRGVAAENKELIAFSEERFAQFLRVPNVPLAIGIAYHHCRAATPETRAGN